MFHVSLPNNSDEAAWESVAQKLEHLDVRQCEASKQSDHDMIMGFVGAQDDALNAAVKQVIRRACQHARALQAARTGDLLTLKSHPEPLCEDAGFTTTLHFAAEAGLVPVLAYLIES